MEERGAVFQTTAIALFIEWQAKLVNTENSLANSANSLVKCSCLEVSSILTSPEDSKQNIYNVPKRRAEINLDWQI